MRPAAPPPRGVPPLLELADAEEHIRTLIRRSCVEHAPESLRTRVITQITVLRAQGRSEF